MHKRKVTLGLLALLVGLAHANTPKTARVKSPKPNHDKGPAETRAERDKRLQRECRGKPNAGACEGYGS